ncbi:MAG: hypothetical protein ACK5SP_00750 [bacterium]
MPQLNFTIPADLLDRIDAAKPNFLDRKGFICLLLTSAIDTASNLPAYRVGAGTPQINGFSDQPAFDPELGRSGSAACATATAVEAVPPEIDQALEPKKKQGSPSEIDALVDELLVTPRERGTNPRAKGTNPRAKRDPHSKRQIDPDLVPEDLLDCQQLLPEFWAVKKGTRSEGVWNRVCNKLRQWTPEQRREALERAIASGWGDVFEPPSLKAVSANTGYVDSITRDRQVMDSFLAMFPTDQEAA